MRNCPDVIHGRASSDTKGGMACQIYSGAILIRLMKEGYTIKGNYDLRDSLRKAGNMPLKPADKFFAPNQ